MQVDKRTRRFIDAARRAPKLSREEEEECIRRCKASAQRRDVTRLIEANLRHVVFAALSFRSYGVPVEDLISHGNVGLMKSLERFDPTKGVRFGTYAAYWIRAEIVSCVLSSWRMTSGPRGALHSRIFFRLRRRRAQLSLSVASADLPQQLAAEFGVSESRMIEMLQQIDGREVSLDAPRKGATESRLDELASGLDQEWDTMRRQENRNLKSAIDITRAMLDERERFILEHRLMRDAEDRFSLAQLAAHFGTSRERARQLEVRTRSKLERQAISMGLLTAAGVCAA